MEQSIWELMSHGGGAMWIVVAFSVIALAVGIERAVAQWNFVTRARALSEVVMRCLQRGALEEGRVACERSPSPIADVFLVGYERLGRSKPEHVVTAVHRERLRVNQDLGARRWMLGTVGATAPFVGLFGTVVGIMDAMDRIDPDQTVTFGQIAGPISAALIVTAAGILVAVEAVILFNFFSQRATRIATEMRMMTDEFLELLFEAPKDAQPKKGKKAEAEDEPETKPKKDDDGDREAA